MFLLPPELRDQVRVLLIQGVHPQQSFATINEALFQLQGLAAAPEPPPAPEEPHAG